MWYSSVLLFTSGLQHIWLQGYLKIITIVTIQFIQSFLLFSPPSKRWQYFWGFCLHRKSGQRNCHETTRREAVRSLKKNGCVLKNTRASILYSHRFQCFLFSILPGSSCQSSPVCFHAPRFNLLCAQLSTWISNLSFSPNTLSLSSLLSHQRHCVSPLIQFELPIRVLLFFGFLSDVCGCLSSLKTSQKPALSQLHGPFLSALIMHVFSVSAFYAGMSILCHRLSLSHVCLSCSTLLLRWVWPLPHTAG